MVELEHLWPDPDRRDDALERLAARVEVGRATLTECERRCLIAASAGLDRRETALIYSVTPETIDKQLLMARRRLRAKNTTHAVAQAIRQGLIV